MPIEGSSNDSETKGNRGGPRKKESASDPPESERLALAIAPINVTNPPSRPSNAQYENTKHTHSDAAEARALHSSSFSPQLPTRQPRTAPPYRDKPPTVRFVNPSGFSRIDNDPRPSPLPRVSTVPAIEPSIPSCNTSELNSRGLLPREDEVLPTQQTTDGSSDSDGACSSQNSLILERRAEERQATLLGATTTSYPVPGESVTRWRKQWTELRIDRMLNRGGSIERPVIWRTALQECKRAFLGLSYLLVPGTFGFGPSASAATVLATLTALGLWIAVLLTTIGSIAVFIRVGRVNNLLTVVSVNRHLEGPSLAFCPPAMYQRSPSAIVNFSNIALRIRWQHGVAYATTHTKTEPCFRASLQECRCVYMWKLEFWQMHNDYKAELLTPRLPLLYARARRAHHVSQDSLSVLIDFHAGLPHDTQEEAASPKNLRLGLFTSVDVVNQNAPSWLPVKTGTAFAVFLSVERFWDITLKRISRFFYTPMLHERRVFRAETVAFPSYFLNRTSLLKNRYSLPLENVAFNGSPSTDLPGSHTSAPSQLNKLLYEMLDHVDLRKDENAHMIPTLSIRETPFNWTSPSVTALNFEFRSFFTTESFRVGQRMRLVGVWGVLTSLLASLNYLDLFYAVFPRYRGRHPRLAVSKFVRIVTCGAACDNHESQKIPIPGD